jgi:hypothetical protein
VRFKREEEVPDNYVEKPSKCQFVIAWMGRCGVPSKTGHDYCAKHERALCVECKEKAIRECASIDKQGRICRLPYCGKCSCKKH